ncbi:MULTISPECIES: cytochrome c oxidase subunit II [Spongiibacter]|jgi:cytochrome c oxidase subunit 2|uniref:cytochrome c oxidase subunit II n=1 Tax=Spongiibacter TaxID=630749 RepID=UPI000C0AC5AF|nr:MULTISPECIES: cytochrome c oxidase subunit II [Spongiibacter]MAK45374.1 cytochrome c oxidase subunit II [Spongiibacter sp.]MBM7422064.1 cytochrome c oxidase subunit 2 [Spongiibacter marinus]MEE2653622.1 cytochrome c oxidase subunit II [Pseudomonadota bacterium]|tara:strand:+ start:25000 stop:26163 length:1164 start_codon:yes stop_codon:yes gene_type:complete
MYQQAKRLYKLALCPVLMLLSLLSTGAWATEGNPQRWQTNMTPGVTEVGAKIYDLHMFVFWVCVVVGIIVFGVMFYSVFAYRKERHEEPATFHENTKLEIAWTVVPFLLLIVMAVPATSTLIEIYDTDDAELDVLITGYQWKWKYEYINPEGDNVSFFSNLLTDKAEIGNTEAKGSNYLIEVDEPLVIPVDTKVRFLVTANDVLHAWWVPALAVKRDAIPGFINEAWTKPTETGVYRGQCAELCGRDHGFMPIVVNVVEEPEYKAWMATKQAEAAEIKKLMAQTFSMDELVERGKGIYNRSCMACHGANGEGGVGKPIANSPIATGEVTAHIDVLVNGVPGSAMQAFGGQLNDVDLAAVVTYTRNAFGNNMGDKVQPIDVYNFKKGQ